MSTYHPDVWVIVRLRGEAVPNGEIFKVLAGWYGGFAGSDYWKINSGITQISHDGDHFRIEGYSGSTYHCHVASERTSALTQSIYLELCDRMRDLAVTVEIVPIHEVSLQNQ